MFRRVPKAKTPQLLVAVAGQGSPGPTPRLQALRAHLKQGSDAIDRGDFVEVEAGALADYFQGLRSARPARVSCPIGGGLSALSP